MINLFLYRLAFISLILNKYCFWLQILPLNQYLCSYLSKTLFEGGNFEGKWCIYTGFEN